MPNLVLMAGPNGAGKTTTALELLRDERRIDEFVNADIIAAEGKLDDIAAGRQMLLRIKSLVAEGRGVAFETTLASLGLRSMIRRIQDVGYTYHLVYVWLPSADMAVERVAARVRSGGHNIPEEVIRRRYERSLDNFFNHYMPMADAWLIIDNSHVGRGSRIAERGAGGPLQVHDERLWQELRKRYMKPTDIAEERKAAPIRGFTNEEIFEASCRGVVKALKRHKELGQSVVVWRDGRIVTLRPEEIEI